MSLCLPTSVDYMCIHEIILAIGCAFASLLYCHEQSAVLFCDVKSNFNWTADCTVTAAVNIILSSPAMLMSIRLFYHCDRCRCFQLCRFCHHRQCFHNCLRHCVCCPYSFTTVMSLCSVVRPLLHSCRGTYTTVWY